MNAGAVAPDNYNPPPWLSQPGYSNLQLQWLAATLHDRVQHLQIENRQLRGLPPSTDTEEVMTLPLPIEFAIQNPVHRQRLLHEGGTITAVPARMQNPNGPDVEGIALLDAAGQPRILANLTAAYRLYDTLTGILGIEPEPTAEHEPEAQNVDEEDA